MLKKKTTKKKYIPNSKEKYMCAKHKKFFNEELIRWKKEIIKGNNLGNLSALLSGFWFALMLVIARRSGKMDVLGGTFVGGLMCAVIGATLAFVIGTGLKVLSSDLFIILVMGAFGIGIGIAFVTWGASYVPAAEVSILVLIESVLGPIWPWIILGESMTLSEILGGILVLGAVVLFALFSTKTDTSKT